MTTFGTDGPSARQVLEQRLGGRYTVLGTLGSGSNGPVYKASQESTGQLVAIKLLTLANQAEELQRRRLSRFRREIAFCSSLYHPDIVRLLDSGTLDPLTHYAVFEYIPGVTLAELLREQGALRVERARALLEQLLPALAYAHGKGIAHRDLKPGNIMVSSDGIRDRPKILDFGISIATHHSDLELERLTLSNEWVGTPCYTAPEQLRGQVTNPKADLYAWGLIFVECLTGNSVVQGKSLAETIEAHLRPTPHVLPKSLASHRLGALLSRVLEKDPDRRPGDASVVFSMLERISLAELQDTQGYLRGELAPSSNRPSTHPLDTLTDAPRPDRVDQRHATVVCCRLSLGRDASSATPSTLDSLLDDGSALIGEVLGQFGATSCQSLAGYVVAYFGLQQAREGDARASARAALEVIQRLETTQLGLDELALHVQIGIHNGPVTVHHTGGQQRHAEGLTSRVAMGLSSHDRRSDGPKSAGSRILVSDDFRRLVARHCEFRPVESRLRHAVYETDLAVFELRGESRTTSLRPEQTSFAGREAELALLRGKLLEARAGRGAAVWLRGEPGIGKSRLADELLHDAVRDGGECLTARCLPEWQNAQLRPLAVLMLERLKLLCDAETELGIAIERLAQTLELDARSVVPLFCVWLSIPLPEGYDPLPWSPQKQRELLYSFIGEALLTTLSRGALLLVEDLHWADPSTLECLTLLLGRLPQRPAFVLLTSREPFPAQRPAHLHDVALSGLDEAGMRSIAAQILRSPETTVDIARMVARCDGVPLYIEELAAALRNLVPPAQATLPVGPQGLTDEPVIPASLRELLLGRVDEAGEAKLTAQFAAAYGREFSLEQLALLAGQEDLALLGDLEELVSKNLLVKRLRVEGTAYTFRHALIRDAAHASMSAHDMRRTHLQIAKALVSFTPELGTSPPDILAHHFEAAGETQEALHYWVAAAEGSALASAHIEAVQAYARALAVLKTLPACEDHTLKEAELTLARGATLVGKFGYTHPEAVASFERVAALVPVAPTSIELSFASRWGLWYASNARAELDRALGLALELKQIADDAGDSSLLVCSYEALCETSMCRGDLPGAVRASRACEAAYVFEQHSKLTLSRGDDPLLASLSFEALAELLAGQPGLAARRVEQGLALADRLGMPHMVAAMHAQAAWMYLIWGSSGARTPDLRPSRFHAGQALTIAGREGFVFWQIYAHMIDAAARIAEGDLQAGEELRAGAEGWRMAGAGLGRCWHLSFIARAQQRARRYEEALVTLDEALRFCHSSSSRYFEAEVLQSRAELLLERANPAFNPVEAVAALGLASESAKRHHARWWQLSTCMTRLRSREVAGEQDERELAELLGQFPTQPLEPPLLEEARLRLRSPRATLEHASV